MKQQLVVANLKMYLTKEDEMRTYIEELIKCAEQKVTDVQCVVCPSDAFLRDCGRITQHGLGLGAQNIFWENTGAFTSALSPQVLTQAGGRYAIIGHSERRAHMGETDAMVARRIAAALANDITPIVCVGEDLTAREDDTYFDVVQTQVHAAVSSLAPGADPTKIVFAYEPVWAISSNRAHSAPEVSGNDIMSMRLHIVKTLTEIFDRTVADQVRILYGGSVNADNVATLCGASAMDGALVGSASTKPKEFLAIAHAFENK